MSVQGLIVAGRRVWHTAHDYTAIVVSVLRDTDGENVTVILGGIRGVYEVKRFLPILTAGEVRRQPVGAVLVDTLTRDECTVDWEGTPDLKVALTEDGEYAMISAWPDRELVNRFALKTLPTEKT